MSGSSAKPSLAEEPLRLCVYDQLTTVPHAQTAHLTKLEEVECLLSTVLPDAEFSQIFKFQIGWMFLRQPLVFYGKPYFFDGHQVLDEIKHLEAPSRHPTATKPAEEFSGKLKGFLHKHFTQANMLSTNLLNEVGNRGRFDRLWHTEFLPAKIADPRLANDNSIAANAGLIAHTMVIGAIEQRSGLSTRNARSRMTGQWIVFDRTNNRNRYLCICPHLEEDRLIKLLRCCAEQYPDLVRKLPMLDD